MANNSIFLRVRDGECGFGILPNHSPPTAKGRMFAMGAGVTLLRLAGRWRGGTEGEGGRNEDDVHGADAGFVFGFGRKY